MSAPIPRRPPATPRVARAGDPRHPRCVALIRSRALEASRPHLFSFLATSSSQARARASSDRRRRRFRPPLAVSPRSSAPQPPSLHPAPTAPVPEPDYAAPLPNRPSRPRAATAIRAGAPPLTPTTSFRPPSTQIESLVSFSALSSPFPTPSPAESRATAAGGLPRRHERRGAVAAPTAGRLCAALHGAA